MSQTLFKVLSLNLKQIAYVLLAIIGIGSLALAFLLKPQKTRQPGPNEMQEVKILAGYGMPGHCPNCGGANEIIIKYPNQIKVNESSTVEVVMKAIGPYGLELSAEQAKTDSLGDYLGRIHHAIKLELAGAAFTIKPSEIIEKPDNSSLPLIWTWSISPMKEGKQELSLNLEDIGLSRFKALERDMPGAVSFLVVKVNGQEKKRVSFDQIRTEILSIDVLTTEGLSVTHFLFLKYGLALIGFLLLYPAVASLVAKLLNRTKQKEPPRIISP